MMDNNKRNKNKAIAKGVKDIQRERSPNNSSHAIKTILEVKRLRDADLPLQQIADYMGKSIASVKLICNDLNKVELTSPVMKELAVDAAKKILEGEDNNNIIKIIDRVFDKDKAEKQGPSVNINLNTKDFANEEYDFVDREVY